MAYPTAAVARVAAFHARDQDRGSALGELCPSIFAQTVVALGSLTAVAAIIGGITLIAGWLLIGFVSRHHHLQAKPSLAFQSVALTKTYRGLPGALELSAIAHTLVPVISSSARVERTPALAVVSAAAPSDAPKPAAQTNAEQNVTPLPMPRPLQAPRLLTKPDPVRASSEPETTGSISPPAQPASPDLIGKLLASRETREGLPALRNLSGTRTAIYDIDAHVVYLPDGERLEAHSGLGEFIDDPRYVNRKARGATPPNIYDLTLREGLFHGVEAIRLNPVDDGKMYGRDGILAHPYMLGPSGQSFGCVSFKDYQRFLRAFKNGEVDRLVVVPHLNGRPPATVRASREGPGSFAVN
jgi:hypothetical protein